MLQQSCITSVSLCPEESAAFFVESWKKNNRRSQLGGKGAKIRGACHCPCGFLSPQLGVKLMNQTRLPEAPNSQHAYRVGEPVEWRCCHIDVSGLLAVYSQAAGRPIYRPVSPLLSTSTSLPSCFPSIPPSNGLLFLERCSYYLLCIFVAQIALGQITNFSKYGPALLLHEQGLFTP